MARAKRHAPLTSRMQLGNVCSVQYPSIDQTMRAVGTITDSGVARQDAVDSAFTSPAAQPLGYDHAPRTSDRLNWITVVGVLGIHAVALLALLPTFWIPSAIVLALLGTYFIGALGISLGYHRLLTHRSFSSPKWFERTLVTLGVCSAQDSPAYWHAAHMRHHQHADRPKDPHSPRDGLWWSHLGWVFHSENRPRRRQLIARYSQQIMRDPYYAWMEDYWWMLIVLASWVFIFASGVVVGLLSGGDLSVALHTGLAYFIWIGCVRTVMVWHVTFSVNSITHFWGYRNYETNDDSVNSYVIGYLSYGEGWHNNHHADPRAAHFQRRWWEVDFSFTTIRLLQRLGLARDVILPSYDQRN
jgi:fatty-acid desaturase